MDMRLKRLEKYRKDNGLKHADIARLLGVNNLETYNNWRYRNSVPKAYLDKIDPLIEGQNEDLDLEIITKLSKLPAHKKRLAEMYLDALLNEKSGE